MSRKETERAERAERDRAEKIRKEKDKDDKKLRDKAEKDRKDEAKSVKKSQDKAEKDRKDKDKSDRKIQVDERARKFEDVLGAATEGCCESCNYQVRTSSGEYQPCKRATKTADLIKSSVLILPTRFTVRKSKTGKNIR